MPAGCTIFTKISLAETLLANTLIEAIIATYGVVQLTKIP